MLWIWLATLTDMALTIWGLTLGTVAEGNPVLLWALTRGNGAAWLLKAGVAGTGLLVLGLAAPLAPRLVRTGISILVVAHTGVLALHALWLIRWAAKA